MNRINAMQEIVKYTKNSIIISANGFFSRDLHFLNDNIKKYKLKNFFNLLIY